MNDEQKAFNDRIHTALGRFVVAFSGVLHALETSTVQLIRTGNGPEPYPLDIRRELIEAAFSDRTAAPIASAFFAVFYERWGEAISDQDKVILKNLKKEIGLLTETRNRLMHDAWLTPRVGGDPGPHPMTLRRVRQHATGVERTGRCFGPDEVEDLAADAKRLSQVIWATVWYHRDGQNGPELQPRLVVENGKTILSPSQ